eukprot:4355810-Pleurochrysis_carterae.AAC.3
MSQADPFGVKAAVVWISIGIRRDSECGKREQRPERGNSAHDPGLNNVRRIYIEVIVAHRAYDMMQIIHPPTAAAPCNAARSKNDTSVCSTGLR